MRSLMKIALTSMLSLVSGTYAFAHPHVFVDANIEIVRNDKGEFTELRHVWRFDELFSATIILDFDKDLSLIHI